MKRITTTIAAALVMLAATDLAIAQTPPPVTLKAAVEQALLGNPDLTARFNAYRASMDAVDVARGGWLPRVDLDANGGRGRDTYDNRNPRTETFTRTGVALSITQLLWDGLGTTRDIERLGHDRLARYFELVDFTEQTALEATRAFYDVQRYRRLVQLAEDNYVQHRYAMTRIRSRFQAGVGRGVDLEQANARVALAESNLAAELANLHDVSARYLRVVGQQPPTALTRSEPLVAAMPASPDAVMQSAIQRSAAISASIESMRAARSAVGVRQAAYQPRVEARLRAGGGRNYEGSIDQRRDASAQVVLNWNLYNGGSDAARVRQETNLLNQAADLRDRACRETRQTAAIAYNDTLKLRDQLAYLDRNSVAIEKARDAYRQQFDIGQRSLLDLLNAENELYTARRAYANADYDLGLAYARSQAAMNQLTTTLGIARFDATTPDAPSWTAGDDAPSRCPVVGITVQATPRAVLDERADRSAAEAPPVTPTPRATTPPNVTTPPIAPDTTSPTSPRRSVQPRPETTPRPAPAASGPGLLPRTN